MLLKPETVYNTEYNLRKLTFFNGAGQAVQLTKTYGSGSKTVNLDGCAYTIPSFSVSEWVFACFGTYENLRFTYGSVLVQNH